MTAEWDAVTYDRISDPMARWGATVLERLTLRGDEHVMDAGCGTGRVTALLADRLPRGTVLGIDRSRRMIEQARANLAGNPRVRFLVADLGRPLDVGDPVDAVFSNATFHWVLDHDALFANLASVMEPGARLVAQCGAEGNVANVMRAVREAGDDWEGAVFFASPGETARRLRAAGFVDVEVWTHDEPTRFEPGDPLETFLATVVLRAHLARIPENQRVTFVHDVASRMREPVIEYVRLNILARRPG